MVCALKQAIGEIVWNLEQICLSVYFEKVNVNYIRVDKSWETCAANVRWRWCDRQGNEKNYEKSNAKA